MKQKKIRIHKAKKLLLEVQIYKKQDLLQAKL